MSEISERGHTRAFCNGCLHSGGSSHLQRMNTLNIADCHSAYSSPLRLDAERSSEKSANLYMNVRCVAFQKIVVPVIITAVIILNPT
jgi:hypothetical protein